MNRSTRPLLLIATVALLVAACSSAAAPAPAASAGPSSGGGSADPSAPAASQAAGAIATADQAAAAVIATDPQFADLEAFNPELIGQCCFYRVQSSADGWTVTIEIGWGDCPAGCIDKHQWVYSVTPAGVVTLTGQSGPPVPSGIPGGG